MTIILSPNENKDLFVECFFKVIKAIDNCEYAGGCWTQFTEKDF